MVPAVSEVTLALWQSAPEGSEYVFKADSWKLAQEVSITEVATCGIWVYASILYMGPDGMWFLE
jgi:hypothetical protein